mgnify:CR=1 FL=1
MKSMNMNRKVLGSMIGFLIICVSVESYNFRRKSMMREPHKSQIIKKSEPTKAMSQSSSPYDLGSAYQTEPEGLSKTAEEMAADQGEALIYPADSAWQRSDSGNQSNPFIVSSEQSARDLFHNNLKVLREKPLEEKNEFASFLNPTNLPNSSPLLKSPPAAGSRSGRVLESKINESVKTNADIEFMPYRGQFYSRSSRPFVLDPGLLERWKSRAPQRLPR